MVLFRSREGEGEAWVHVRIRPILLDGIGNVVGEEGADFGFAGVVFGFVVLDTGPFPGLCEDCSDGKSVWSILRVARKYGW